MPHVVDPGPDEFRLTAENRAAHQEVVQFTHLREPRAQYSLLSDTLGQVHPPTILLGETLEAWVI